MKTSRTICNAVFVFGCLSVFCGCRADDFLQALKDGAETRFVVCVSDDAGAVVKGASVDVLMGMNLAAKSYHIKGVTDEAGCLAIEGRTTGDKIIVNAGKQGYYGASRELCYIRQGDEHEVVDSKWQPWNQQVPLVIREVKMPEDKLLFHAEFHTIPVTNTWVGFDMAQRDWVAPYGNGIHTDFSARLSWDGRALYETRRTELELRFHDKDEGFYEFNNVQGCEFNGPYRAEPQRQYCDKLLCSSMRVNGVPTYKDIHPGRSLVARTRCRHDPEGRLVSANYSIIRFVSVEGGWNGFATMRIGYLFNPIANDTNLEPAR